MKPILLSSIPSGKHLDYEDPTRVSLLFEKGMFQRDSCDYDRHTQVFYRNIAKFRAVFETISPLNEIPDQSARRRRKLISPGVFGNPENPVGKPPLRLNFAIVDSPSTRCRESTDDS